MTITEKHHLGIRFKAIPGQDASVFNCATYFPVEPGQPPLWYEATVSSVNADTVLEMNKTLELGEEAAWTASELEKLDAAADVFLPALGMVKGMDGVGFYNNNGLDYGIKEVTSTIAASNQKPSKPYKYW